MILLGSEFISAEIRFPGEKEVKPNAQNTLRSLDTTKHTYREREKMFPEAVYKFQRRRKARF